MSEGTDKLWRTNPAQYKAEKTARDLRAGVSIICETSKATYETVKSVRTVLTAEEQSRLEIRAALGSHRRVLRLITPEKNS